MTVSFCCNDHRDGSFTGRLAAIAIGSELDLACCTAHQPAIAFGPGWVRIARKKFKTVGPIKGWYGNWCWDAVSMNASEARAVVKWLALKPWFECEGGCVQAGRAWDALRAKRTVAA